MQIIKQVKCELTSAEERRIMCVLQGGTMTDEIIDLINGFIDEAFQNGLEYDGEG